MCDPGIPCPDDREITCPECNGDGGGDSVYGVDRVDGSPLTQWNKCTHCDGLGWVTVMLEPITIEDLDDE